MALEQLLQIENDTKLELSFGVLKCFAQSVVTASLDKMRSAAILGEADKLLTIDEVAKELRVSRRTLERWHKSKYLEHIDVGNRRRYRLSDVLKITNP